MVASEFDDNIILNDLAQYRVTDSKGNIVILILGKGLNKPECNKDSKTNAPHLQTVKIFLKLKLF